MKRYALSTAIVVSSVFGNFCLAKSVQKRDTVATFRPGLEHLRGYACRWHQGAGGFDHDRGEIEIELNHLHDEDGRRIISNLSRLYGDTANREELDVCLKGPQIFVRQEFIQKFVWEDGQCIEQKSETISGVIKNSTLEQNLWAEPHHFVNLVDPSYCE